MTAIGIIAEPTRAILWADTTFFLGDRPGGHHRKLMVNSRARLAGCGTGSGALCSAGREAVMAAAEVHQLADMLPGILSRQASRLGADDRAARASFLVAGWSPRWRRVVAFSFLAPAFRSEPVSTFASPTVDLAGMDGAGIDDLLGTVQCQIADLSRSYGCTVTGQVHAAVISSAAPETRTLLDLGGADFEEDLHAS